MNKEKIGTLLLGASIAAYTFLSMRQAAREVTPRVFDPNEAILCLVNFDDDDARFFRGALLPSWMGVLKASRVANEVVLFPDDSCSSVVDQVRSEARQAFYHLRNTPASVTPSAGRRNNNNNNKGATTAGAFSSLGAADSTLRPTTLAMRHMVEIAGSSDLDAMLSPIEIARQCQGLPIEVTTLLALCTGPDNSDVDIVRVSVKGRVCSPLFVERLATVRKQQAALAAAKNNQADSAARPSATESLVSAINAAAGITSAAAAAVAASSSSSDFVTVYDLFEPAQITGLFDDYELNWQRFFGQLPTGDEKQKKKNAETAAASQARTAFPTAFNKDDNDDDDSSNSLAEDGCIATTEYFVRRWRREKLAVAASSSSATSLSALLLEPWKYRAFLRVAHHIMYGQLDRRYGSVFSGISRGMAHAGQVLKRMFSFSPTGTIASSTEKAGSWIAGLFSSSSSSSSSSKNNKASEDAFSLLSMHDFGSSGENPLGGDFIVLVTVMCSTDAQKRALHDFADVVGVKLLFAAAAADNNDGSAQKNPRAAAGECTVMFGMSGQVDHCTSGAFDFALQLTQLGLGLRIKQIKLQLPLSDIRTALLLRNRQKMEAASSNSSSNSNSSATSSPSSSFLLSALKPFYVIDGPALGMVPVRDFEARNPAFMSPQQYFETLFRLRLPESEAADVLAAVRRLCATHEAQLLPIVEREERPASASASSGADAGGGGAVFLVYFVSLQMHSVGAITALERADSLKKELEAASPCLAPAAVTNAPPSFTALKNEALTVRRTFTVFDSLCR